MKKHLHLLLISFLCSTGYVLNAQSSITTQNGNMKISASPVLNGAWHSTDNRQFVIMNDGYFSAIGADSTGTWKDIHAGSFTMDSPNTASFKVLYSSYPEHVGSIQTIEYSLSGGTLTMKWFKKLIDAKGNDITSQVPQGTQTQFVKMNR
ncbi:MAG TPA: hypothetical protein VNS32_17240 [Flavisolibacter sp.]|nr:hypothetical protein [Flavisolibacter sp.]